MFRQQQAPAAPPVPQAPATHSPAPALGLQGVLEMMKQMQPQAPFQQPQQTQTAMAPNFGAMFSQLAGMNQQGGLPPQHPSTQEDAERKRMRDNVQYDNQYDSQWARGKRTKSNDPKPVSTALAAFTILSGPDSNPLDSTRLVSLRASSGPRGNAERVKTAPSVTTPKSFHLRSLPDVIWSLRLIPGIFRATAFPRLQQFFFFNILCMYSLLHPSQFRECICADLEKALQRTSITRSFMGLGEILSHRASFLLCFQRSPMVFLA